MRNDLKKPIISLDIKWCRMRIHKTTLYMLGSPEYIQILVNPDTLCIAIRPVGRGAKPAHKVDWDSITGKSSYNINSKYLLYKLCGICNTISKTDSYKIVGQYDSDENIAYFYMKAALPISNCREDENE